jgi:hypothetical protein
MTNESTENKSDSAQPEKGNKVGPRGVLNYLKDNKNSKISAFIGKASEIYGEIGKYAQSASAETSHSPIAPDQVIKEGMLGKAIEIAKLEWVKAKLESEDPIECAEKYSTRMSRMNDEYHLKNLLFANVYIIGYMKDGDSKEERLLVSRSEPGQQDTVLAVNPVSGMIVDTFEPRFNRAMLTLKRLG